MTARLSIAQMREFSVRTKRPFVAAWLRSIGWSGRADADGWPIVELTWWNDNQNQRAEASYEVDVDALRKAA